ncbi:aldo/keto reductase [Chryseosolibacter indicus]|uniref:Aldo/keto reductase n=1 Tax=Chryseosolibacter indicus TaxID=2782351 RepID=A0ABS5VP56_9BACT|nr:aldo/keto reductase [Chryseosolibacter indicus]MBT1703224.1 aldo/keto reductase [Chryseosolibacter indicus]
MELRQLGNSSVKVTPLAFGAWAVGGWMWGGAEENESINAIRASYEHGMTTIDTAPVYGFGRSEELVAKAMQGVARDRYQILTKYGMNWENEKGEYFFDSVDTNGKPFKMYKWAAKEKVRKECEDSLRRLKTDYIDLYQIHWPDATTPIAETMGEVDKLIKEGKVRAAGVCNYSVEQVEEALKAVKLVSNQVPYSMVNRGIEKDIIPQAQKRDMVILPYSPLQRGLLTGKITRDYKFNEGDNRPTTKFYKPENLDRINAMLGKLKPIAEKHNATLSQLVINWTANRPAMGCVLVGARNEKQVKENVASLSFTLSKEELDTITAAADALVLVD